MKQRHTFVLASAAALLLSSSLRASELASAALAQDAGAALGLPAVRVVPILVDGGPGAPATAMVDLGGAVLRIALEPRSVRGAGMQVLAQGADGTWTEVAPEPVATFRGAIPGLPGSVVAVSLVAGGIEGWIRLPDGAEWWVQPLAGVVAGAGPLHHALYAAADVPPSAERCGLELLANPYPTTGVFAPKGAGGKAAGTAVAVAELGCDADYEYYSDWGSVGATENRIESVINAMNAQYEAEVGITHVITTILVRTSPSQPYTSTDAATLLNQFRNQWNSQHSSIQRDTAQLFTGKQIQGGTIGIAWVGVVCNLSYAYSMVQSDFNGVFAYTTDLSAHELGHSWDADHCSCPSYTMNPYITGANTFHPTISIPQIVNYKSGASCLGSGGGGGTPTSVHVASIAPTTVGAGKSFKAGKATVTVRDDQGNPVVGAVVGGTFSGDVTGDVESGATDSSGSATLTSLTTAKGKVSFTICVSDITMALPYAPADNVETCDSN
jgi:hypothetical protein